MPEGLCKNRLCRQPVVVSPRYRNTKYCVSCEIDRRLAKLKLKTAKPKTCKNCDEKFVSDNLREKFCKPECSREFRRKAVSGAIERKRERRVRKKLKKRTMGAYPTAGFSAKRKQMSLFEKVCEITGITASEHKKKFGRDLHLDHIIPARIASEHGVNPHDDRNLMWLSHSEHAQKKAAEEQLKGKGGAYGFVQVLRQHNWPTARLVAALKYSKMYSENLPL